MRILDENGQEVFNPDLKKGYLTPDRIVTAHYDAVPAAPAKTHEEKRMHPNGGISRWTVIDSPAAAEIPAWDEYEEIQRYILYTPEELAQREQEAQQQKTMEQRMQDLEAENKRLRGMVEDLVTGRTEAAV